MRSCEAMARLRSDALTRSGNTPRALSADLWIGHDNALEVSIPDLLQLSP